ncbi:MAG: hypothetical protein AB7E32_17675 [Desulfovibrio sp.]
MANMDYPGPCPSCGGIDGCGSGVSKQAAVAHYCKGLEMELNAWKARLYDVLVDVGNLDSRDQEKLADTLNLIKSTVKEIEAVRGQMLELCPVSLSDKESELGGKLEKLRVNYTKALQVISPGWFGG